MALKIFRGFIIVILLTGIVALVVGWLITLPKLDSSKLVGASEPTTIYDRYGHVAMRFNPSQGTSVPIEAIPINLQHAVVATEDARFYQNQGIDLRGIARAFIYDILHHGSEEGASTITEQLAKIVYLTDNQTLTYKLKEIALGAQIQRQFTKDQILDMYLNRVYLGVNATGVHDAAMTFFGKDLKDLVVPTPQNLADCALIGALPRSPAYYDPFVYPQHALDRRNLVLSLMQKNGYITDAQRIAASKMPLDIANHQADKPQEDTNPYPWYLDAILEEADSAKNSSISAESVMRGGLNVYTNLDPALQSAAQNVFADTNLFPDSKVEGAAVFTDAKTGGIEALIGGRQHVFRGFDRALDSLRSPGSSIKPIIDYGPAIDVGKFGPDSLLTDKPTVFGNNYQPRDWDNFSYHRPGEVTMREALVQSWNIPAVWTLDQIGEQTGINYARKDGLPILSQDDNLSVAIGGMAKGVSPKDMAQGYEAFANGGQMEPAHVINKVTNMNGDVLYQHIDAPVQVYKPSTAATITNMLLDVVSRGTGELARIAGREVAGKTGTSNFPGTNGDMDAWFVGYTPSLVGSVWLGYDVTNSQYYLHEGGSSHPSGIPAALWSKIVSAGLAGQPEEKFPDSVTSLSDTVTKTPPTSPKQTVTPSINDLQAVAGSDNVTLRWTPLTESGVVYSVFRSDGQQGSDHSLRVGVTNDGQFIDKTVSDNQTYYYIVVASDANGKELCKSNMAMATVGQTSAAPGSNGGDSTVTITLPPSNSTTDGTGNAPPPTQGTPSPPAQQKPSQPVPAPSGKK